LKLEDWDLSIDAINANAFLDGADILTLTLSDESAPCSEQADYVRRSVGKVQVLDCSIPGVAEGDCQQLVAISTTLDANVVAKIRTDDRANGEKQIAKLRDALVAAHLDTSNFEFYDYQYIPMYLRAFDTIISIDSSSWSFDEYASGSVSNVALVDQSHDGSNMTLRANFRYTDGKTGWLAVKFPKSGMPCLTYWNFADECRDVRFPDVSAQE
jgi:hypothetical protein